MSFRTNRKLGIPENNPKKVQEIIDGLVDGRLNIVEEITIDNATSFPVTVTDDLVSEDSIVVLSPKNTAARDGKLFVTSYSNGSFQIDDSVNATQTGTARVRYAVIG